MHDWQNSLTALIQESGGALVGYGDLGDVPEAVAMGLTGGISIGVPLAPEIVERLGNGPTLDYHHEYHRINGILDELDRLAADWLTSQGYRAHPLTRDNVDINWEAFRTPIPHKTVALRAGLGWIGRSALMVTPVYGPAIRFSSVLTDAPIPIQPVMEDRCGSCLACKAACPAGAIEGVRWSIELVRDDYYSASACKGFASEKCNQLGVVNDICGICIHACPFTQKYLKRKRT